MKTLSLVIFTLTVASSAMGVPKSRPEPKFTEAICKADLKAWSAEKAETLTIKQIDERMNTMVACADQVKQGKSTKKKDEEALAYLNEFYRTHTELANRAFDFILKHDLKAQFDEEDNSINSAQSAQKSDDEKH